MASYSFSLSGQNGDTLFLLCFGTDTLGSDRNIPLDLRSLYRFEKRLFGAGTPDDLLCLRPLNSRAVAVYRCPGTLYDGPVCFMIGLYRRMSIRAVAGADRSNRSTQRRL